MANEYLNKEGLNKYHVGVVGALRPKIYLNAISKGEPVQA